MFWRIVIYSIVAILLYHIMTKYVMQNNGSCGCNIEDDDIRRDALIARVENKKKEKEGMEKELHNYMQETMGSLGMM